MFQFLNLHPKKRLVCDCVKRALALLEDRPYEEISRELNRFKKESKAQKFNDNRNWKLYLRRRHAAWKMISFPAIKGEARMDGKTFCLTFPKGRYLLRMAGHLTACVDGVIYDTFDCSCKCVYTAWEVK